MSYTPTTWTSGDAITAEKLNKIEGGVEAADTGKIITLHEDANHILDMTYQEIADAFSDNIIQLIINDEGIKFRLVAFLVGRFNDGSEDPYGVCFTSIETIYPGGSTVFQYRCADSTGYPSLIIDSY